MEPPVDNKTEFAVHPQLLLDRDGEKLVAIVKAGFELQDDGSLELAPPDRKRPIRFADVPWGEPPEKSSIAYPADVCLRKPGVDVIVVGKAHAPGGKPVPSFDAYVRVGPYQRTLRLFGTRLWAGPGDALTAPSPVAEVELKWEHAWGGFDDSDPSAIVADMRNPIGVGVVRDASALKHAPGPSIEDPGMLIASARTKPPPAGVLPIGRAWDPRRAYAGTYDELWQETRAPLPPDDFDDRFNLCGAPGLSGESLLRGDEEVATMNLLPGGGARSFRLPRVGVVIEFRIKGKDPIRFEPHLDTLLLDFLETGPEKPPCVELTWRASVRPPRQLRHAKVVVREREVA